MADCWIAGVSPKKGVFIPVGAIAKKDDAVASKFFAVAADGSVDRDAVRTSVLEHPGLYEFWVYVWVETVKTGTVEQFANIFAYTQTNEYFGVVKAPFPSECTSPEEAVRVIYAERVDEEKLKKPVTVTEC